MDRHRRADHPNGAPVTGAPDRLGEVPEGSEGSEVARIYSDIRGQLGVPMVNLVYRHLASAPGMLAWAWASVRPVVVDGTVARAANQLTANIDVEPAARISVPALRALHVDEQNQRHVEEVFAAYNRANPRNLVVVNLLLHLLQDPVHDDGTPPTSFPAASPEPPPLMREMIDPADMSAETTALIATLPCQPGLTPSLYRHLANWPELLATQAVLLEPARARLDERAKAVQQAAHDVAASLADEGHVPRYRPPGLPSEGVSQESLVSFLPMIPAMIIVGRVFEDALPDST